MAVVEGGIKRRETLDTGSQGDQLDNHHRDRRRREREMRALRPIVKGISSLKRHL